jgi:hypothetical protein
MVLDMSTSTDALPTHGDKSTGLTDDELAMLDLERSWWKHIGAKETLIRERFGISSTIYYAGLNRLIDRPEALAADPMLVRRLQRIRDTRRRQRSARRLG